MLQLTTLGIEPKIARLGEPSSAERGEPSHMKRERYAEKEAMCGKCNEELVCVRCPQICDVCGKVQRRASKCALRLNYDEKIGYEDQLELLEYSLENPEKRGLMLSLIQCYKTIHGINGLDPTNYLEFASQLQTSKSQSWF